MSTKFIRILIPRKSRVCQQISVSETLSFRLLSRAVEVTLLSHVRIYIYIYIFTTNEVLPENVNMLLDLLL